MSPKLTCAMCLLGLVPYSQAEPPSEDSASSISVVTGHPALDSAIQRVAERSSDPEATRRWHRWAMAMSTSCYPDNLTEEQWEKIISDPSYDPRGNGFVEGDASAFGPCPLGELEYGAAEVWLNPAVVGQETGPANRAQPCVITYSFVTGATNTLDQRILATSLGGSHSLALDEGREYIRQGMAYWARWGGIRISEVKDNGSAIDSVKTRSSARGDIRVYGRDNLCTTTPPIECDTDIGNGPQPASGGDFWISRSLAGAANQWEAPMWQSANRSLNY